MARQPVSSVPLKDEEVFNVFLSTNGRISRNRMIFHAKLMLMLAELGIKPNLLRLCNRDGAVLEELEIPSAPGGFIHLDLNTIRTRLGAELVVALVRLGAANKVKIVPTKAEGGAG